MAGEYVHSSFNIDRQNEAIKSRLGLVYNISCS
jgi:hypothetical protein